MNESSRNIMPASPFYKLMADVAHKTKVLHHHKKIFYKRFCPIMSSVDITKAVGKSTRAGFGTVTPYLIVEKIDPFVEFLGKAFGAKETYRSQGNGGGWHCEVQIGNDEVGGYIMIGGDQVSGGKTIPVTLFLYVENADQVFQSAVAAGAKVETDVQDGFAGPTARGGSVIDPFGFTWHLATEAPEKVT
jgi:PhnB protein